MERIGALERLLAKLLAVQAHCGKRVAAIAEQRESSVSIRVIRGELATEALARPMLAHPDQLGMNLSASAYLHFQKSRSA